MAEYRIDDLARAAGTTTRNVRAYQERGLLPAPSATRGRANIYDDTHLERLRIIDALLQRGFTIAHIADFITSWETGKDLAEVLGLQHAVTAAWAPEGESMEVPRELVETFLGTDDTDLLERVIDLGLARVGSDSDSVVFTEPRVLEIFGEMSAYGFNLRRLVEIYSEVSKHVDDIATLMIGAAESHIAAEHGRGWLPDTDADINATATMINHMREVGVIAVHTSLNRALDRGVQQRLGDYLATAVRRRGDAPTLPQPPRVD